MNGNMETTNVKTTLGTIKALKDGEVLLFKGIPYASTPRFKSPVLIENLDNFDATGTEKDCIQHSGIMKNKSQQSFFEKEFHSDKEYDYTEETVCLNIITAQTDQKLPVVVFVHGGGFESGSVNDLPYGMTYEYIQRGVILVSISYRLNIFGFYRNRNVGLEDIVCAMEWVYRYIAQFNGDHTRVSLMGQSAGAMCISDLLYTEVLENRISGAVMMSGCGAIPDFAGPYTFEQSKEYWDTFLKENGFIKDEELLKVPSEELWKMWYAYRQKHFDFHTAQPGIDGKLIYDRPSAMMKNNRHPDIPLLMSVTSQDYLGPVLYGMTLAYAKHWLKHKKSHVYACMFDRTLPGNSYKAFHSADLWYAFGNLEKSWRPFEAADVALKDEMIDAICNFAATGSPNTSTTKNWEPFDERYLFRVFKDEKVRTISPLRAFLKTLTVFLFDKGPM